MKEVIKTGVRDVLLYAFTMVGKNVAPFVYAFVATFIVATLGKLVHEYLGAILCLLAYPTFLYVAIISYWRSE